MPRRPLTCISPLLMAFALAPAWSEEAAVTATAPEPVPAASPAVAEVEAEALYVQALAAYRQQHFVEARELVERAVAVYPPHARAQQLRQDVLAVLAQRDNRLQMAASWFGSLQEVRQQELVVRLAALLDGGDKKLDAGDYAGAELDYDRVEIGIRSFPYRFEWGDLPQRVAAKRLEARAQVRANELRKEDEQRAAAAAIARRQAQLQEEALRAKVDELLRRAQAAFDKKDYKRAEIDAWNAYELDRRREDARKLYLRARADGHEAFDAQYREDKVERIARVHEEIHRSLIPQTELLVYPEDWARRSTRQAAGIGANAKVEPWVKELNDKLELRISFDWADQPFDEVITYLRRTTGINFYVDAKVAAGSVPPVNLKATNMKVRDALKWVMDGANLKWAIKDQVIQISGDAIVGAVAMRLYDVTDLISPVQDFAGKELAYAGASAGGKSGGFDLVNNTPAGDDGKKALTPEELQEFIKKNTGGDEAYAADKGTGIEARGATLFISQTPEKHGDIQKLIEKMREQAALQVNIGVRLLDVRKGFFEEIGVEYHNNPQDMLNTSSASPFGGTSAAGYARVGANDFTSGTFYAGGMPGNRTAAAYSANLNATGQRGLALETSWNYTNFLNADQINAIFSAVEEETDATILQNPVLTCINGQRANAAFLNQFAYIASYDVVDQNYDPVIEILNFGNVLDVRPVVSSDRKYVTMEIRPSAVTLQGVFVEILNASRVVGSSAGNGGVVFPPTFPYPIELPNVQVQTMRSTVRLPDRGSLVIGGFTNALRQRTHIGIPFLAQLPFVGRLFGRNGTYDESRRIFYLLNATIVDLREQEKQQ